MDLLKKFFPLSFGAKDVASLVIKVIIYVVAGIVFGFLIGLLAGIPVVGLLASLIGAFAEVYVTAGIVLTFLSYFKVIK